MSDEDRHYCSRRAEEELARARASADQRAARLHYELAGLYLDRVHWDTETAH